MNEDKALEILNIYIGDDTENKELDNLVTVDINVLKAIKKVVYNQKLQIIKKDKCIMKLKYQNKKIMNK